MTTDNERRTISLALAGMDSQRLLQERLTPPPAVARTPEEIDREIQTIIAAEVPPEEAAATEERIQKLLEERRQASLEGKRDDLAKEKERIEAEGEQAEQVATGLSTGWGLLEQDIKAFNEKQEALATKLDSLDQEVADYNARVQAINERGGATETEATGLEREAAELQGRAEQYGGEAEALERERLSNQFDARIEHLRDRGGRLDRSVVALNERIGQFNQRVETLNKEIESRIAAEETRVQKAQEDAAKEAERWRSLTPREQFGELQQIGEVGRDRVFAGTTPSGDILTISGEEYEALPQAVQKAISATERGEPLKLLETGTMDAGAKDARYRALGLVPADALAVGSNEKGEPLYAQDAQGRFIKQNPTLRELISARQQWERHPDGGLFEAVAPGASVRVQARRTEVLLAEGARAGILTPGEQSVLKGLRGQTDADAIDAALWGVSLPGMVSLAKYAVVQAPKAGRAIAGGLQGAGARLTAVTKDLALSERGAVGLLPNPRDILAKVNQQANLRSVLDQVNRRILARQLSQQGLRKADIEQQMVATRIRQAALRQAKAKADADALAAAQREVQRQIWGAEAVRTQTGMLRSAATHNRGFQYAGAQATALRAVERETAEQFLKRGASPSLAARLAQQRTVAAWLAAQALTSGQSQGIMAKAAQGQPLTNPELYQLQRIAALGTLATTPVQRAAIGTVNKLSAGIVSAPAIQAKPVVRTQPQTLVRPKVSTAVKAQPASGLGVVAATPIRIPPTRAVRTPTPARGVRAAPVRAVPRPTGPYRPPPRAGGGPVRPLRLRTQDGLPLGEDQYPHVLEWPQGGSLVRRDLLAQRTTFRRNPGPATQDPWSGLVVLRAGARKPERQEFRLGTLRVLLDGKRLTFAGASRGARRPALKAREGIR